MNGTRSFLTLFGIAFFFLILMYSGESMAFDITTLKINSPSFKEEQHGGIKYRLSKPENYNTSTENKKKYPLIVYLHGAGERGTDNKKQSIGLTYLGNGFNMQARTFRKKFPCFVYVPQCPPHKSWQGDILNNVIKNIEYLKSEYPLDQNRIYLIGYSMGGSGTYELARQYYDFNGQLFAGIIRLAGQGSFNNRVHEIISKSSIWLHIGLQDTPLRIEKAREAYAVQKEIHKKRSEQTTEININGKQSKTSTLIIDGQEKVKITEYSGVGHAINLLPFDNPEVLEWLFEKK